MDGLYKPTQTPSITNRMSGNNNYKDDPSMTTFKTYRSGALRTIVAAAATAALLASASVAVADQYRDHQRSGWSEDHRGGWDHDRRGGRDHDWRRSWNHGRHIGWSENRGRDHRWQHRGERMGQNDWTGAQPAAYRMHRSGY